MVKGTVLVLLAMVVLQGLSGVSSGFSLWSNDSDSDFAAGTMTNITVNGTGGGALLLLNRTETWGPMVAPNAPPVRTGAAMAYDSDDGVFLLFGGGSPGYLNDLWSYNVTNNTWTRLTPAGGPSSRIGSVMVYDSRNKVFILFGGYDGGYRQDTWAYNYLTNIWTSMNPGGPPMRRYYHGMVFDSDTGVVVLYGGYVNSAPWYLGDTWTYNYATNTWTSRAAGPAGRYALSMAYDSIAKAAVVFGGYVGNPTWNIVSETWAYSISGNTWTDRNPPSPPTARYFAAMVFNTRAGESLLYGGYSWFVSPSTLSDTNTYNYTTNTWSARSPPVSPTGRYYHTAGYDSRNNVTMVFGGWDAMGVRRNDTWVFGDLYMGRGMYESPTLSVPQTQNPNDWLQVSWSGNLSDGTGMSLQIATNSDSTTWAYFGPDGTANSAYTNGSGQIIWKGHDGDRFLRYRATIYTNHALRTPRVDAINITYNRAADRPALVSPTHASYLPTLTPTFRAAATDADGDALSYVVLITQDNFNTVSLFDQSLDQTGWIGASYPSGNTATFTLPGASALRQGETYEWRAFARDGTANGSLSVVWRFTTDITPPSPIGAVRDGAGDDIDFTSSLASISSNWDNSADRESGVARYWYAIGTSSGGTDIVNWTSSGKDNFVERSGLTLVQGKRYYISVKAENLAGLFSPVAVSDGLIVDSTPPAKPAVTDEGAYTSRNTQFVATWSADDAESGIVDSEYAVGTSSGGTNVVGWTSGGTLSSIVRTDLLLVHGTTYFASVKVKNGAGLWSEVATSDGITVDTERPSSGTLTINGGAAFTNRTAVQLTLTASDALSGVKKMSLSNDGVVWTAWEPFNATRAWTLTSTEGLKTVYARVSDGGDNAGDPFSATVLLDTTPPAVVSVSLGPAYATDKVVLVIIDGSDYGSGLGDLSISSGGDPWGAWEAYGAVKSYTLTGGDGVKNISVRLRDRAGNTGTPAGAKVTLDTTPPVLERGSINGDAATTRKTQVKLEISFSDATSGVSAMALSFDNATWEPFSDPATVLNVTLPPGEGEKSVYVKLKDRAGNTAAYLADTITLVAGNATVTVASPKAGKTVKGTYTIGGKVTGNPGVTSVEVRLDGGAWTRASGTDPWSYELRSRGLTDGTHMLEVRTLENGEVVGSTQTLFEVRNKPVEVSAVEGPTLLGLVLIIALVAGLGGGVAGWMLLRRRRPPAAETAPPMATPAVPPPPPAEPFPPPVPAPPALPAPAPAMEPAPQPASAAQPAPPAIAQEPEHTVRARALGAELEQLKGRGTQTKEAENLLQMATSSFSGGDTEQGMKFLQKAENMAKEIRSRIAAAPPPPPPAQRASTTDEDLEKLLGNIKDISASGEAPAGTTEPRHFR